MSIVVQSPNRVQRPFTYLPLDVEQIRILKLESILHGVVSCTLRHASSEDVLDYYALSYCWGSEPLNQKINVNGGSFWISTNLLAALKVVHQFLKTIDDRDRCLWIDAICINQMDNKEKSLQVRRMGQIYRQAERILVWLGDEADDSSKVMSVFNWLELYRIWTRITNPKDLHILRPSLTTLTEVLKKQYGITEDNMVALHELLFEILIHNSRAMFHKAKVDELLIEARFRKQLFDKDDPFWSAFLTFMDRDWFSRVWTYQETILAKNATVICGSQHVDWQLVRYCQSHLLSINCWDTIYGWNHFRSNPQGNSRIFERSITEAQPFSRPNTLMELLMGTGTREAKDPRDYVYGIIGLVEDRIQSMILVDYDLPESAVFAKAAKVAIQIGGTVSCCQMWVRFDSILKTRVQDLPSWCPDFSSGQMNGIMNKIKNPGATFADCNMISESTQICLSEFGHVKFDLGLNIISISGIRLDTIDESSDATMPFDIGHLHQLRKEHFASWESFIEEQRRIFETLCGKQQREWVYQMAVLFLSDDTKIETSQIWLQKYIYPQLSLPYEELRSRFEELRNFCGLVEALGIRTWPDALWKLKINLSDYRLISETMFDLTIVQKGRCFFTTASGRVGYSSKKMHRGDNICYIPGSQLLHVLSPKCDRYIANASVEGSMGDAI